MEKNMETTITSLLAFHESQFFLSSHLVSTCANWEKHRWQGGRAPSTVTITFITIIITTLIQL